MSYTYDRTAALSPKIVKMATTLKAKLAKASVVISRAKDPVRDSIKAAESLDMSISFSAITGRKSPEEEALDGAVRDANAAIKALDEAYDKVMAAFKKAKELEEGLAKKAEG